MRRHWFRIAACALVGLVAAGAWLYAQQSRPETARPTDFSGKVVFVETTNGLSLPLSDVCIKEVGGRTFVVGEAPRRLEDGRAYTCSILWVPLNDVIRMSAFASYQDWHSIQAAVKQQAKAP
jgi:hypothetical protein